MLKTSIPTEDIGKSPMIPGRYLRSTSRTSDPKTSHIRPEVTLLMKEWLQGPDPEEGTIWIVPRRMEDGIGHEALCLCPRTGRDTDATPVSQKTL